MKTKETYNGWKNRQTWNVALWINNDYLLYDVAVKFMQSHKDSKKPYVSFIRYWNMENDRTPDGIKYLSTRLDYAALNDMMRDLVD